MSYLTSCSIGPELKIDGDGGSLSAITGAVAEVGARARSTGDGERDGVVTSTMTDGLEGASAAKSASTSSQDVRVSARGRSSRGGGCGEPARLSNVSEPGGRNPSTSRSAVPRTDLKKLIVTRGKNLRPRLSDERHWEQPVHVLAAICDSAGRTNSAVNNRIRRKLPRPRYIEVTTKSMQDCTQESRSGGQLKISLGEYFEVRVLTTNLICN